MKRFRSFLAQAVLSAMVFTAIFRQGALTAFAAGTAFPTAAAEERTKASASIAYRDMKAHYSGWLEEQEKISPKDSFWEMVSCSQLGLKVKTGTEYSKVSYEELTAVELAEYLIAMVIDGVNPEKVRAGKVSAVAYLEAMEQGDGSFRNTSLSADYGTSYYNQDIPLFALYICGRKIGAGQIRYYENFLIDNGGIGMDWGYGGDPTDPMSTGQALLLSDLTGISFEGRDSCVAYMEALGENITTNSNNMSWYISWKAAQGKKDEMTDAVAVFLKKGEAESWGSITPYGYDFEQKTFLGYSNEGANKDCARAIAEYEEGKSFLTKLKTKYQTIVRPKQDSSASSETTVSKPVKTGTWKDPVTDGTWKQSSDGSWGYTTNAPFRSTWGYILNPYAPGEEKNFWFYFDASGKMLTGWQLIGGKWYFLNDAVGSGLLGACALNTVTPDGYTVNENGEWTVDGVVQTSASNTSVSNTADVNSVAAEASNTSDGNTAAGNEAGTSGGSASGSSTSELGSGKEKKAENASFKISVSISANVITTDGIKKNLSGSRTLTVEEESGFTAFDALREFCGSLGYEMEGDGEYVSSIGGLAEYEGGQMSGWMYSVNGKYPNICCGEYEVRKGDRIVWKYVTGMQETSDV